MPYKLIRANLKSSDAVAYQHRLARHASMPHLPVLHTADEDRRFFRERVFKNCDVWIADADSSIVGFSAFRTGWLDHLYVHPKYQRHGIGSALLTVAMKTNVELQLWVFQRNEPAGAFYAFKGFKSIITTDGLGNEDHEPDALYRWSAS